jgi:hypothetical protein
MTVVLYILTADTIFGVVDNAVVVAIVVGGGVDVGAAADAVTEAGDVVAAAADVVVSAAAVTDASAAIAVVPLVAVLSLLVAPGVFNTNDDGTGS